MSGIAPIIAPISTNVLLDQQKGDTGSASSLINILANKDIKFLLI